jgi:hypothetical protein
MGSTPKKRWSPSYQALRDVLSGLSFSVVPAAALTLSCWCNRTCNSLADLETISSSRKEALSVGNAVFEVMVKIHIERGRSSSESSTYYLEPLRQIVAMSTVFLYMVYPSHNDG